MYYTYAKSVIGYNHINNKMPCQDFSSVYSDKEKTIITCCDGHGGSSYIRSDFGSKVASYSAFITLNSLNQSFFSRLDNEDIESKIKLNILCEYNRMIEQHLSKKPIRKSEVINLDEEEQDALRLNPVKAYGTTLTGAMVIGKRLVVVGIGDTEALVVSKGEMMKVFDDSDEPVANVTYSMCQEDAYKYIKVKVLDFKNIDAVILCTDGLTSPYQTYLNFDNSFIKPMMNSLYRNGNFHDVDTLIDEIASKLGVGDDVSLAVICKDELSKKYYK